MSSYVIELLQKAFLETIYMSFVSTFFVIIIGLILGLILYSLNHKLLFYNKSLYFVLSFIINVLRSIPFIILIFLILPYTKLLVGTMIGPIAFIPALVVSASPFFARIVESNLNETDEGLIEVGVSFGGSKLSIIKNIVLKESIPLLIKSATITSVTIVGYSAMAGVIGGGGLGEFARQQGMIQNNMVNTLVACGLVLFIVLILQVTGDTFSKKLNKK